MTPIPRLHIVLGADLAPALRLGNRGHDLFVCERGLAVRLRTWKCRFAPLSCGYVPARITPRGLVTSLPLTAR
jgi:hypothetical protein